MAASYEPSQMSNNQTVTVSQQNRRRRRTSRKSAHGRLCSTASGHRWTENSQFDNLGPRPKAMQKAVVEMGSTGSRIFRLRECFFPLSRKKIPPSSFHPPLFIYV